MRAAIRADQTRAVDGEADGKVLDRDIVYDLVIGALQEGGIDRAERAHTLRGKPCGERHAMLFGDANVESAVGVRGSEFVDAGSAGHRGGNCANPGVGLSQFRQCFAEYILVRGRPAARALVLLAGDDVEFDDAMIFVGSCLSRRIAMALFGHDVDQHRSFGIVADIFENRDQLVEIVPVDWADIIEAQFFKQVPPIAMPRAYSSALDAAL